MKHGLILAEQEDPGFIYLEFGAGRAGLSSFVAAKLIELGNVKNTFLLIDRDSRRFKLDKHFKEVLKSFREKMDIADFDLGRFMQVKAEEGAIKGGKLIAIAKHLCGGATDLALTSMSLQEPALRHGVSIATCCHHCCDALTYVNMPYLLKFFTEEEIKILPRFSSWAICVHTPANKRRIGFKVKRIIDFGRCLFIEEVLGLKVTPYQYCDPLKESPENILLVADK